MRTGNINFCKEISNKEKYLHKYDNIKRKKKPQPIEKDDKTLKYTFQKIDLKQ